MAQINLGNPALQDAHARVRDGQLVWMVATLPANNELKLQATGDDLEELAEEFEDGRIHFGFVRVQDPISKLQRLVLIQWCGEGVPVMRKGLFSSHAATVASRLLKGSHVTIQARGQDDLDTASIVKRVSNASGSKYISHNEPANQPLERPAAVGSSYVPVGRPDIASLTATKARPEAPAKVGTNWTSKKDELADIRAGKTTSAPIPAAPRPVQPTRPVVPAPAAVTSPTLRATSALAPTPPIPSTNAGARPSEERPGPVGTAYQPVQLAKPGKLGNRFPFAQQAEAAPQPVHSMPGRTSGTLTWSQRQEQAKKQREEEDSRSSAAISAVPAAPPAPPAPSFASRPTPASIRPRSPSPEPEEKEPEIPAPPPPPPAPPAPSMPTAPGANLGARLADQQAAGLPAPDEDDDEEPVAQQTHKLDNLKLAADSATQDAANRGLRAVVLYDYAIDEDNEMPLVEGEEIFNIEKVDEGWWTGEGENGAKRGLFPADYVQVIEEEEESPAAPPAPPAPPRPSMAEQPAAEFEEVPPPPPPAPPPPPMAAAAAPAPPRAPSPPPAPNRPSGGNPPFAVALYDYTADEDNEIGFNEGDRISDIEQVDPDWWQGKTANGEAGLFPAAYVQLEE